MDNLVITESTATDFTESEFVKKKWVYATDSNGQSYQSQVVIDTTTISNSGAYPNWSEAFMVMPLVVTLQDTTNAADLPVNTTKADMAWGFKAGFWHMINSMSVQYNNGTIVQETPFLNVFCSFKAMTEWGELDVKNDGASTGFYPDNASSWTFNNGNGNANAAAIVGSGQGLCNNANSPVLVAYPPLDGVTLALTGTTASPYFVTSAVAGIPNAGVYGGICSQNPVLTNDASYNQGFLKRQYYTNYDPLLNPNGNETAFDPYNQTAINNPNTLKEVNRNYKLQGNDAGTINWNIVAKLRLKDLTDFFGKMPLSKGGTFRFLINTNQTNITFSKTQAAFNAGTGAVTAQPTLTLNSVSINGGLTCPLMIASNNLGQGSSPLTAGTYNLSVSIFKNNFPGQGGATTSNLTSCRLYVPLYTFSPMAETNYLKLLNNTKKIVYTDIFQFTQVSVGSTQPFNFLVSNGLPNIQFVLVVPLISASALAGNPTNNGTCSVSTLRSPFTTTGGTPDPITLTNFNVAISNQNLFEENLLYDYEVFREQLLSSFQLNGDLITGMTSGLISEKDFSNGMRYYYADASRGLPSDDGVSKSVQVKGTNSSLLAVDLLCFVGFKKYLEIDVSNGAVLSKSS